MTINLQVVLKLYEFFSMIRPTFPMIVTMRVIVVSLDPAITVCRWHHNPSIPSSSGFPLETCQFLHTMIIFTTPFEWASRIVPYERLTAYFRVLASSPAFTHTPVYPQIPSWKLLSIQILPIVTNNAMLTYGKVRFVFLTCPLDLS